MPRHSKVACLMEKLDTHLDRLQGPCPDDQNLALL